MVWIYALPAWLFMLGAVVVAAGLAAIGLRICRTYLSPNDAIDHNDVAGPVLATIGTMLAVMLSFMVAGVWQEYDQATQTAQTEASAISDLHYLADAFPGPMRRSVQEQLDRYAQTVATREWALMRHGALSYSAQNQAITIQRTIARFHSGSEAVQAAQAKALDVSVVMLDARRNRILANSQGIPMVLWATMLALSCITVAFSFYFRVTHPRAHTVMVVTLAAVIAITISLIAELDYPFRGDIAVSPDAFRDVLTMIHGGR